MRRRLCSAERLSDRIGIISEGKLIAFGTIDELLARNLLAGAPEPFDEHLGYQEALHGAEIEVGVAVLLGQALVLLHDRHCAPPRKRDHLGYRDAGSVAAQSVGERLAAHEGDVVERGNAAGLLHLPDELRA